ncbi:MAG: right-handed parallel beta-helix repeat-containing protein [Planctomycetota bacterium]|nr:right-handed parallel beta-helix repeat-containing protein [Planctomycetota bacterium]
MSIQQLLAAGLLVLGLLGPARAETAPAAPAPAAAFFVSPAGDDAWSGTAADPARDGSDGPFATLERARAAVRELLADGPPDRPIVVALRGGFYELARPIVFTPDDSGAPRAPVSYRAYRGEQPILSGGRRLGGWRIARDGRWRLTLPRAADREWTFSQLWVDDQRRFRPRLPARGYRRIAGEIGPSEAAAGRGHDRFRFAEGEIDPNWHNLDDVELLAFHIWSASRMRIAEIDPVDHIVTFTAPTRTMSRWGAFRSDHRYLVINVREALDAPGAWYLDRPTGELTYIPRAGETPDDAVVIAPRLETLVRFAGDVSARRFVRHVRLEGLTFAHANWNLPPRGQSFPQAEVNLGAAIEAIGARHVTIDRCVVRHVGQYAVALGAGCRENALMRCALIDLGGGGVKLGTGGGRQSWMVGRFDGEDPQSAVLHNTVAHCLIAHGGRLHPAAVGVWIGHAAHSTIEYNDIFDFYYTGVSVGWTWGYATPSRAHHNEIAHNRIHAIGRGVLSDMAGVYTLGVSPGTTAHHNIIHDIDAFDYGGWGLYTDEGSSDIVMSHNLVYRTKTGGFHQHYGKENIIRNNIFAEARIQQLQRTRTEEHLSFTFDHNIVYWTGESPLLGGNWRDDNFSMAFNVYWNPDHPEIRFPGDRTLEQWRTERGHDSHSIVADPMFRDPMHADYELSDGSPALGLGFEPWDFDDAGCVEAARLVDDLPPVPAGFR